MVDYNSIIANINDINGNYWIKANAGCGKTTKLVGRFLFLLKNGIKTEDIVCITYTNAGAKEMKDRVINELLTLQQCNKAQQVQNINYNSLQIDTIHGFCQKILIKQKILPENVKIISSNIHEKNRIVRQIIQSISNAKYLENDVYNITKSISYDEFCQIINDVIEKQNNFRELCEEVFDTDINNNNIQNHKDLSFLLPEEIRYLKNTNLQELTNHINDTIHKTDEYQIIKLFEYIKSRSKTQNTTANDVNIYDLNEWKNIVFLKDKNEPRKEPKNNMKNSFDIAVIHTFREVQNYFITKQNKLSFDSTMALLKIAKHILHEYEKIKKQLNVITYDDILFEAKKIAKQGLLPPTKYLILDEAQDTNPISWEIISNFKQKNGDNSIIFVVGDEKQSIYSFQGANLDYYNKYYYFFKNRTKQENKQNWHDEVILDTSYRSKKEILKQADELCNNNIDAFCNNNSIGFTIKHKTAVDGKGVVVDKTLILDDDNKELDNDKDRIKSWITLLQQKVEEQNRAKQVAESIAEELLNISKQGKTTAIIVPKRNTKKELAFDIIGELQKFANVNFLPELAIKQIYFQDLLAIIKFSILQNDDLNLACLLKSELFGFTDDDLMSIRNKTNELLFNNLLSRNWQEKSKRAVVFLKTIISKYTITDILKEISLFVENNTQCFNIKTYQDAIKRLQEIHTHFLESGENDLNLRSFVDYINGNNYKNNNIQIKEGIFFSTIHGVKGLEFDNVVLLDFDNSEPKFTEKYIFFERKNNDKNGTFLYKKNELIFNENNTIYYDIEHIKEKQRLENKRLMYVAITRAKNGFYHFHL